MMFPRYKAQKPLEVKGYSLRGTAYGDMWEVKIVVIGFQFHKESAQVELNLTNSIRRE